MTSLSDIIRARIEQAGPMNLADFMALALGHPVHGYYMKKDPFGAAGDFTTAPEISQMFGELIGLWIANKWLQAGSPAPFVLAEAGPGRGTLMADALRATRRVPGFHAAASIHLLEMSPVLRAKQAAALAGYDVQWHEQAEAFFNAGEGPFFLIANEFLDALPARQAQFQDGLWRERVVGLDAAGQFIMGLVEAPFAVEIPVDDPAKSGNILEWSPAALDFAGAIGRAIARRGGAGLLIDYGYAEPGYGDTLQAVREHRYVPVLHAPGEADLTVHVNFKSVADALRASGCIVSEPVGQGKFLQELGIRERADTLLRNADERQGAEIERAVERLTGANQMGDLFKVLTVYPPEADILGENR